MRKPGQTRRVIEISRLATSAECVCGRQTRSTFATATNTFRVCAGGWDRQTRKKPAVPCRSLKLLAGSAASLVSLSDAGERSGPRMCGNAIPALT